MITITNKINKLYIKNVLEAAGLNQKTSLHNALEDFDISKERMTVGFKKTYRLKEFNYNGEQHLFVHTDFLIDQGKEGAAEINLKNGKIKTGYEAINTYISAETDLYKKYTKEIIPNQTEQLEKSLDIFLTCVVLFEQTESERVVYTGSKLIKKYLEKNENKSLRETEIAALHHIANNIGEIGGAVTLFEFKKVYKVSDQSVSKNAHRIADELGIAIEKKYGISSFILSDGLKKELLK